MGLLTDIQNDALSDSTPVSTMLRKCMVLAHKLDSALLEDWVKWELHGYPKGVELPDYRQIGLSFKVTEMDVVRQYNAMPVPQYLVRQVAKDDKIDIFQCRQAIGTVDVEAIRQSSGTMAVNMDNYAPFLVGPVLEDHLSVLRFWGEMPGSKVIGIVEAVRNQKSGVFAGSTETISKRWRC